MSEEEMEKEENLEHEVLDRLKLLNKEDFDTYYLDESYIDAMLKARNIILKLYKRQEEVIDLMAEVLNDYDYDNQCDSCHTDICSASVDRTGYTKCIKEHFYKLL